MKRKQKNYTPEEKVIILKRHLVDRVPVHERQGRGCQRPKGMTGRIHIYERRFFRG